MLALLKPSRWFSRPPAPSMFSLENIERVEGDLLCLPQVEMPLVHRFGPGVYLREITMPAGAIVIGHEHLTEHFNIVLEGSARVVMDGQTYTITAPAVFKSSPGVRKVLYITEKMRWMTVHPTAETDVETLESQLVRKSETFRAHEILTALETLNEISE